MKATPILRLAAAFSFAVLMASCTRPVPAPIKVGALYPLSGSQGSGGTQEFRGVQLAADLVNSQGGVDGRPIQLHPIDAAGADAAPAAVADLKRSGADLVIGSYGTTISGPAGDAAANNGMLFWESGAGGAMYEPSAAGHLVFRVAPSGSVLGRSAISFVDSQLAPLLHRDPSTLRFAVAGVNDAYGRSVETGAIDELRSLGLHLVGRFLYDYRTVDMRKLVQRIGAAHPDVLFVAAYIDDGVALRRQIVRQHVPLLANIGTSSSYCMPMFGMQLGRSAVGVFASDKPDAGALNMSGLGPTARAVLVTARSQYRSAYGGQMPAPALAGFSAAWALFHDVMPRATSTSPSAVAAAALATHIPSGGLPNGSGLDFAGPGSREAGSNLRASSVIWEWTGVDHRSVVWPSRFATHPIVPMGTASR